MSCAPFDLIINMASFMEMTTEQLSNYLDFASKNENCYLYSQNHSVPRGMGNPNKPIHPKNLIKSSELERTVDEEIGKYF